MVQRRERLLVVERTGWGKSAVYFIATRIFRDQGRGPTLIVSPLLALMRDQIRAAERIGIGALSINSTNRDEWPILLEKIRSDEADALLISPERLANDEFVATVLMPIAPNIGLLVVDEAHCISDWGHDFRPDYRRLVNVLRQMPSNVPVLGTTATANDRVIEDVQTQLGRVGIIRGSLMRETLALQTLRLPTQHALGNFNRFGDDRIFRAIDLGLRRQPIVAGGLNRLIATCHCFGSLGVSAASTRGSTPARDNSDGSPVRQEGSANSTGAKGPSGHPRNTHTTVNNKPANSKNTE